MAQPRCEELGNPKIDDRRHREMSHGSRLIAMES
jgi:hypothetical protein